jgi:acetyl-CoA C-acetyltransferase
MKDLFILSGRRTPIGTFGGGLSGVAALDLGTLVARAALEQSGVDPARIDHSAFGMVSLSEPNDLYLSRIVAMGAGAPQTVSGVNVNMLCGSGLQAVVQGAQALALGQAELALVGGVETISRTTHLFPAARFGKRMGDTPVVDLLDAALTCPFGGVKLGVTAETLAQEFQISRAAQDACALESHIRARAAIDEGRLAAQIVPVELPDGRVIAQDEGPRATSAKLLGRLPAAFVADGTVTAGNSGGLGDAAAALVLARDVPAGQTPLARITGFAQSGVDPARMGYGPVLAVRKLLAQTGLAIDDFDLIESNEAFAAQALVVAQELGFDHARANPDGGAIAHGHPVGATGAILTVKAAHGLARLGRGRALVAMCVGGGQGIALSLEAA